MSPRTLTKISSDKTARKFDGIVVNARNCDAKGRAVSCKSRRSSLGRRVTVTSV